MYFKFHYIDFYIFWNIFQLKEAWPYAGLEPELHVVRYPAFSPLRYTATHYNQLTANIFLTRTSPYKDRNFGVDPFNIPS